MTMTYRRIGRSGLQLSTLSYGSWVTFGNQQGFDDVLATMAAAWDGGCNFFDNAEAYAGGQSEELMGRAFAELGWARETFVVSTKFYWGIVDAPNMKFTLNRKYLMQAIDRSLERFQLDFIDIIYCHRADPNTPIEETVFAMHDIIASGKALYWGTSEWSAAEIREAWEIADRHHLHKPIVEQPEYNLLKRGRVEVEYADLYEDLGIGTTIWSPLASGILTGKYSGGIPDDSRAATSNLDFLSKRLTDAELLAKVDQLAPVANDLGCTQAQLALAWCTLNPNVSTVITGASRVSQVFENFEALAVADAITPDQREQIESLFPV